MINHDFTPGQTSKQKAGKYEESTLQALKEGFLYADATRDYDMQDTRANNDVFQAQDNYKQFQVEYDAYAKEQPATKANYKEWIDKGFIRLTDHDTVEWSTFVPLVQGREEALKGAIYAYGLKDDIDNKFATNVQGDMDKYMNKQYSTFGTAANMIGHMGQWATEPGSIIEMMTPGVVRGKTLMQNVAKAFGYEFAAGLVGESFKQFQTFGVVALKKRAKLDGYYKEAFAEIGLNSIGAGVLRAAGSATVDKAIMRTIKNKPKNKGKNIDVIFARYNQRMQSKLIRSEDMHRTTLNQVDDQLNNGKPVEIQTDIDINTKTSPEVKAVDLAEQQQNLYIKSGDMEQENIINKATDEVTEKPENVDLFVEKYKEGEELFSDDEILQNLRKQESELSPLSPEQEIEAMEEVIPKPQGFQAQEMMIGAETIKKTDFNLIQARMKTREFNRKNPDKKRTIPKAQEDAYKRHENIADELLEMDFIAGGTGQPIFAKFADNLAAGTVAGIEEDEQGNISFNPEKFVLGLGGYTAAKAMFKAGAFDTLPQELNAQVKKYFGVELEPSIVGSDPRAIISKPRKGWTKERIEKELKSALMWAKDTNREYRRALAEFSTDTELENHIFYHGTGGGGESKLKPSVALSKKAFRGGGYDEDYYGISLSSSRNKASNFTGESSSGTVFPVILSKNAKIIERPDLEDALDIEDYIETFWTEGIDAVKIGDWSDPHSEQEIVILNPRSITVGKGTRFQVFKKERFENLTIEAIKEENN